MLEQTHLSESLTIPKPAVSPLKTSARFEVPPLKQSCEKTCSKEPESSSQTVKVLEQSSPPKPVVCVVTQSGLTTQPLSYLKDFVDIAYHSF